MPSEEAGGQAVMPTVRILHSMARSGATVVCKCLATMANVVLLSENHPDASRIHMQFNPIVQANSWYGLLTPEDMRSLPQGSQRMPFADEVALVERRCRERGLSLILRDWTHLDFQGVPYTVPGYRLKTAEALAGRFQVLATSAVRHPIDQWLSQENAPAMRGKVTLEAFLDGYRRFAEVAAPIGFIRFEDFTRDPDGQLVTLCQRLNVTFDPGYGKRWRDYRKITGDVESTRKQADIEPASRRPVPEGLLARFEENQAYQASLRLLGYSHPG
jgi:hypothetical protein